MYLINKDISIFGKVVLVLSLCHITAAAFLPPAVAVSSAEPERSADPVIVTGAQVPDLIGLPVEDLAVFRFDEGQGTFVPLPFQVDETVLHTFNEGTAGEFTERMVDIFNEDDGLLDADDEIVFLFGDVGNAALPGTAWPEGAEELRIQVQITDQRPGQPEETGWVYLFSGSGLPLSQTSYLDWGTTPTSDILTDRFTLEYEGNWLLTGFRIEPPCGSGADLIDRVKGRALTDTGTEEDEESWNLNSEYLGGRVGPVRAVRYVRGANSGVNTIHRDEVYRDFWKRHVNLRVHAITEALIYVDWRPISDAMFFSPEVPQGVPVDGIPDSVPVSYVDWSVYRSPGGGIVALNELPESPYYQEKQFHYRDDASYDDTIFHNPDYSDEDDSAYGNLGLKVLDTIDSNIDPIPMTLNIYPLCSGTGDSDLGSAYQTRRTHPLQTAVVPQWKLHGPVETLQVSASGEDVELTWQPVQGAAAYRVYRNVSPGDPHESWTLLQETTDTSYLDPGMISALESVFYSVAVVGEDGGEEW
jgi:hypothetical protein